MPNKLNDFIKKAKPYTQGFFICILIYLITNYPKLKQQFKERGKIKTISELKKYAADAEQVMDTNLVNTIEKAKEYVVNNLPKNLTISKEQVIDTLNNLYIVPVSSEKLDFMTSSIRGLYLNTNDVFEILLLNKKFLKDKNIENIIVHELYHFIDARRDTLLNNNYNNIIKTLIDTTISDDKFKYFAEKLVRKVYKNKKNHNDIVNILYNAFINGKKDDYLFSKEETYARLNAIKYAILTKFNEKKITENNFLKYLNTLTNEDFNEDIIYLIILQNNIKNIELLNKI